jgi:hypothetical protein
MAIYQQVRLPSSLADARTSIHHRVMTDKSRLKGLLMLGAALALVLSNFFQVYYVGSSGDGDLLWTPNRAYLLVDGEHRGSDQLSALYC